MCQKAATEKPRRSPRSTKNRPKGEKSDPRSAVLSIFVHNAVFLDFSFDFGWIFLSNIMGKNCCFFHVSVFFSNLATLTKHCILQVRSYFFIFQAFAFGGKTCTKNDSKIRCRKNIEKLAQLEPKITQKSIKIEIDALEILKKCQKNYVF